MPSPSRTHPAPERLAALARGELQGDAAAALRRHLDHCASCRAALSSRTGLRSGEGDGPTFHLATEPTAPAKPAESLPPHKKSPAGRVRKRRRHEESPRGWLLFGGLAAVAGLLVIAIGVGALVLVRLRLAPAAAEQAKAPPPVAPAAVADAGPIKVVPAIEPGKAPPPVAPAAAPAPAQPAPAPAAQAPPQPPPAPPAPPLTAEEKRWQPTFRARLAHHGRATCGYDKLKGKPLTGVLVDLEVLAEATKVPLTRTTVTALDKAGGQLPPSVLFWAGPRRPDVVHLDGGVSVTAFPGEIHIGTQHFRFESGVGLGGLSDLVDKPIAFEDGAGLAYDLHARGTYRVGFVFAGDSDQLTAVRVLGHLLPLDPAGRDNTAPVAVAPAPMPGRPAAAAAPDEPPAPEPPAARRDAPAKAEAPAEPDVYHHIPQVDVTGKSKNIWVRQDGPDSWKMGAVGPTGDVAADASGNDVRLVPDALGSTGLLVVPGRLGYTTLAGLRFSQRARLNIWDDGTVEVDQVGVRAKGEDGDSYVSQRVTFPRRTAVVMVRAPAKAAEVPKSVELTDDERNERTAANKLKAARELMDDGKRDRARALCEEILKKYPQTKAAPEAKKLLGE